MEILIKKYITKSPGLSWVTSYIVINQFSLDTEKEDSISHPDLFSQMSKLRRVNNQLRIFTKEKCHLWTIEMRLLLEAGGY